LREIYIPSGEYSPSAIILVPLIVAIASVVTSIFYGGAVYFNPIIYISLFLPYLWALSIGLFAGWTIKSCHVRNPKMAGLMSVVGIIPGYLFHWLIWVDLVLNQSSEKLLTLGSGPKAVAIAKSRVYFDEIVYLLKEPLSTFQVLSDISLEGIWTIFNFEIKGTVLLVVWAAELIILFVSCAKIFSRYAAFPYSEEQRQFFKKKALRTHLRIPNEADDVLKRFSQGEYGYLFAIAAPETDKKAPYLQAEFFLLEREQKAYMSLNYVTFKGKKSIPNRIAEKEKVDKSKVEQLFTRLGERSN
jgi:hypothetical protein